MELYRNPNVPRLARKVEVRDGNLYLDGQPFPWVIADGGVTMSYDNHTFARLELTILVDLT